MRIAEEVFIERGEDVDKYFPDAIRLIEQAIAQAENMDREQLIGFLNEARQRLHEISPFKSEPVDFVKWVKSDNVTSNDYNPNKVAPPEMKLLELSIVNDGYTQPIVSWSNPDKGAVEVIDGFHRNRVGKESPSVRERVHGYLPVVDIRNEQSSKNDRMASTIRHNRARGKHQVDAMSEIVIELKNRNWRNARIARELGMDEEEVLRLCQISGLEHLFSDRDFSRAWEADDSEENWDDLTDYVSEEELEEVRIPNEKNEDRIFHTYDKWECHKAGFYAPKLDGLSPEGCRFYYSSFLANPSKFRAAALKMTKEWKHSCEHYLTNFAMNRIAWIGQASVCYEAGVPSKFCSGYNLLTDEQKDAANEVALEVLNEWLADNGYQPVDMDTAMSKGRQVEIY